MAEVRAADGAGTGNFEFDSALAPRFIERRLVSCARRHWRRGVVRAMAAALVPGLLPVFDATRICRQPVHWPSRSGAVFLSDPDTGRSDFEIGGERRLATQTAAPEGKLLATSQGLQPIGPAFLTEYLPKPALLGFLFAGLTLLFALKPSAKRLRPLTCTNMRLRDLGRRSSLINMTQTVY